MFPLDFPYSILSQEAEPGDMVLDPFCGRGTTNYAARLLGLTSFGVDSNPVAVAISEAKLVDVTPETILAAAKEILDEIAAPDQVPDDEFWQWAYEESVLQILCRLREGLLLDCTTDARKALRAIILGALHGPRNKTTRSYFSNQSPRTYAPKPRYALKFWKTRNLTPEKVDVLSIIETRAKRYYPSQSTPVGSKIQQGDSRDQSALIGLVSEKKVNWVITSPPYYGMNTYVPDQWLRYWFVGGPPSVDYSTRGQVTHFRPDLFVDDLRKVWRNVAEVCEPEAKMVIRFGAIHDRKVNGLSTVLSSLRDSGWETMDIRPAGSASKGRRQASYFLTDSKEALEEYDVWTRIG
jgi:hypothetical protein